MSETQTLTLTDFLLARIAEDEAAAREVRVSVTQPALSLIRMMVGDHDEPGSHDGPAIGVQISVPRVLAECEAKRRIVELHSGTREFWHPGADGEPVGDVDCAECRRTTPCGTLRALALPYADHPAFRAEWAL